MNMLLAYSVASFWCCSCVADLRVCIKKVESTIVVGKMTRIIIAASIIVCPRGSNQCLASHALKRQERWINIRIDSIYSIPIFDDFDMNSDECNIFSLQPSIQL